MTLTAPKLVRTVLMTEGEAFRLLAGVQLGRVVFSHRALPAVRPVNHVVDGRNVVFRTHAGAAAMDVASVSGVVAYEADSFEADTGAGWSVIVTGVATAVRNVPELTRYEGLLPAWGAVPGTQVVRITPSTVTGYRLM